MTTQRRYFPETMELEKYEPVDLIDSMGDDNRIADVARVSFDSWGTKRDKNEGLLGYLAKHEHTSPFRHVMLSLRVHAPIYIARQLVKHQVGLSWNEVSRRYVSDKLSFYMHESMRKQSDSAKQGSLPSPAYDPNESWEHQLLWYDIAYKGYMDLLERGVCAEQARAFLPLSTMTSWIWTGSLPAFLHMVKLRQDQHAQAECWPIAAAVRTICENHFPIATRELLNA